MGISAYRSTNKNTIEWYTKGWRVIRRRCWVHGANYFVDDFLLKQVFVVKNDSISLFTFPNFNHHMNITIGKGLHVLGFMKRNTKTFCIRRLTSYALLCSSLVYFGIQNRFLTFLLRKQRPWACANKCLSCVAFILKYWRSTSLLLSTHEKHIEYTGTFSVRATMLNCILFLRY